MPSLVRMPLMILAALVALDLAVAGTLSVFEARGVGGSLVRYFEYGRSVPGKIAQWQADPDTPGNLYAVSWRPEALTASARDFAAERPDSKPVVRAYGMSFTDNILKQVRTRRPDLPIDSIGGPGASPNYVYAQFLDDRANRREGDVAMIGILASSVAGMKSMSNRTRVFEQPAPLTFPIFRPDGDDGLARIDPLVESQADQDTLVGDPDAAAAWQDQLEREDSIYSPYAFALPWLDRSPLLRLVRRSLATSDISRRNAAAARDPDALEALRRMVVAFSRTAREDGQIPLVVLIQNRGTGPDLTAVLGDVLERHEIPYLSTIDIAKLEDPRAFLGDGHFTPEVDGDLAASLLNILDEQGIPLGRAGEDRPVGN